MDNSPNPNYSPKMPLRVEDVISEIRAELAYFQRTTVSQHKWDSVRRLEQNLQLLQNYVNSLREDILGNGPTTTH